MITSLLWLLLVCLSPTVSLAVDVEMPSPGRSHPIEITADQANHWQQGAYEVWLLRGSCILRQGDLSARSQEAVIWIDRAPPLAAQAHKVISYLEGDVQIDYASRAAPHPNTGRRAQSYTAPSWLGRWYSTDDVLVRSPVVGPQPETKPAVYQRAVQLRQPNPDRKVTLAQFGEPITVPPPAPAAAASPGQRRVRIGRRSSVPWQMQSFPSADGSEQISVLDSGVAVLIEGAGALGVVDIATDRLVIWTGRLDGINPGTDNVQRNDTPLEFYMEGNIVFREGDRVIFAQRMYYNVRDRFGVVLDAEMLTPVPNYQGLLRVKAEVLRQIDAEHFSAHGASLTSSRLGVPSYWFQSEEITLEDRQQPSIDPFTGQAGVDAATGEVAVDHQMLATSQNNFVYFGGLPVVYWPTMATDLTKPGFYIDQIRIKNDSVFGTQILTDLDMYQLFGIRNAPDGTRWTTSLDYLSERGPALGTHFEYDLDNGLGVYNTTQGVFDAWGIKDDGLDDLGFNRRALQPDTEHRGRILWRHRQPVLTDYQLTAELGLISDRNFLDQYFEDEWDNLKDQRTGVELKRILDNGSWSITADARVNDFFTQTEWLPRLDHFQLGHSVLGDRFTWYEHSHVAYANLKTLTLPTNPDDPALPLAWERDTAGVQYDSRQGIRAATRQELDLPFRLGPVKLVPYVLGEVAHWGEDRDALSVTRLFGQTGVRASVPLWTVDPGIQSELLNLNGLAHKVEFDGELLWADADQDLDRFPLYDPVDDDNVEDFRRRFFVPGGTFFGIPPLLAERYDERSFALRNGMQRWVASPATEIADDLTVLRLGAHQRWQTKRGLPGNQRIIDWLSVDVEGSYFPQAERDDFGANIGAVNYDVRWHVGDRVTLLSDGYFDTFGEGLRTVSIGGYLTRPGRTSAYLGFRSIEGPISSNILTSALTYRLSAKWITTSSSAFDFGETGNRGYRYEITRVGESFLMSLGLTYDRGRDNVSLGIAIEPRFLASSRRGQIGGVSIAPAGTYGLE